MDYDVKRTTAGGVTTVSIFMENPNGAPIFMTFDAPHDSAEACDDVTAIMFVREAITEALTNV